MFLTFSELIEAMENNPVPLLDKNHVVIYDAKDMVEHLMDFLKNDAKKPEYSEVMFIFLWFA